MEEFEYKTLGRYQIQALVGRGGFATVYRALDPNLEREVALKVLHPVLLSDPAFTKRFRSEARALAGLNHPHIITVYDVSEADGRLYIVMELANGPNLGGYIEKRGALPWEEMLALVKPVCAALDHAHSQGVVHRDLKPANILIDSRRGPLLSDFGLARLLFNSGGSITSVAGGIIGTPEYIAPELWELESAGPQADIYALGCIVYEMLTGQLLFKGQTPMQILRAHDRGPQFTAAWPEGVPGAVQEVLLKALARQPQDRYLSAGSLWNALEDTHAAERAAAERSRQSALAAGWRSEMEKAIAEKEWRVARMALGRWLAIQPDHPAALAARAEIERLQAEEAAAASTAAASMPAASMPAASTAASAPAANVPVTNIPAATSPEPKKSPQRAPGGEAGFASSLNPAPEMVVPTGGPAGAAAQAQPAPAGLSAPVEKPANRLMTWLLALVTVFVALLFFSFQVEVGNIIGLVYLVLLALATIPHPTLDKAWPAVKPAYITIAFIQTIISTLVIYDGLNYSWNLELIIPGILTAAGGPVIAVLLFIGVRRSVRQPDAAPKKIEAPVQAAAQPAAPAGISAPVEKPANRLMTWLLVLITVLVALVYFSFNNAVSAIIGLVYLALLALTTIPHPALDKAWPVVKTTYITIAVVQTFISIISIYNVLDYSWYLEIIIPSILTAAGELVIAVLLFIGAGRGSRQPDGAPGKFEAPAQAAGEQPKSWRVVQWLFIAVTLLNTAAVLFLGSWFWPVDFGLVITMMIPVALLVTIFLPALAEARRFLRFFFAVYCLWMVIFAVFNSYLWVPAGFVVMLVLLQLDRTRDPIPAVNKGKG